MTASPASERPGNGLAELDSAAVAMPGWIGRGLVLRLLCLLSLSLVLPFALPWNGTLAIPLRVVADSPSGSAWRAIGVVPPRARVDLQTGTCVFVMSPGRPAATCGRVIRTTRTSVGNRIIVALPGAPRTMNLDGPARTAATVTARIVVRRGTLGDAVFGNILASIRR